MKTTPKNPGLRDSRIVLIRTIGKTNIIMGFSIISFNTDVKIPEHDPWIAFALLDLRPLRSSCRHHSQRDQVLTRACMLVMVFTPGKLRKNSKTLPKTLLLSPSIVPKGL